MRAGLTQRELAKEMGVDKSAVPYWERTGGITNDNLVRAARILGVKPSVLLGEHSEHDVMLISDPKEITCVTLFKKLPPSLQDVHIKLLYAQTGTRQPPELKSDPRDSKRVKRR